jgi:deoxyribose-phosphate aldolase
MCAKAKQPLRKDFIEKLGLSARTDVHCGAVCVYPNRVPDCVDALKGSGVGLASVAAGFPAGQTPMPIRIEEIKQAVAAGATEIDIVISREHVIAQNWQALYDETKAMRAACGAARLKCILAVGELPSMRDVYKASIITMMAGADFIKTSTGKEAINATMSVGILMARAVREYHERTGFYVGFKPAGGIRSAKDATAWLSMMYEELGEEWTHPNLFRIGASALLADIERQIEHGLSSRYAALYYMPM